MDIGARVPNVDASRLKPLELPTDYMPMLPAHPAESDNEEMPYIEAEFAELDASTTARLIAK